MTEEELTAEYQAASPEWQRAFDLGWRACYQGLQHDSESTTPPWLRRFFWHSLDSFVEDYKVPWFIPNKEAKCDEFCNPVFGIRLIGGVLYVRYGRTLRGPKSPECEQCKKDQEEAVWDVPQEA